MKKRIRITLLLQSIIISNWVLAKLLKSLSKESLTDVVDTHTKLIFIEPNCSLDEKLDGTRESLKSWNN